MGRWWRSLFPSGGGPAGPDRGGPSGGGGAGGGTGGDPTETHRTPHRRHYTAPPADADPQRESRLGAVLQAVSDGPLTRAELGRRLDADDWGPGRLDAVVDHGLATHVLVEDAGGVRARYTD